MQLGMDHQLDSRVSSDDLETIESGAPSKIEIILEHEFAALCPVDSQVDYYDLTIEYRPNNGEVLEIHSFSQWVGQFRGIEAPQEAWCDFICATLWDVVDPTEICVTVEGEHYGVGATARKERTSE